MKETTITKNEKQLTIVRDFDAPVEQVWRAWTESDLLDQWWAPKPWKAQTKSMEFREGGTWLYAMQGPDGEQHWARMDFERIVPGKSYSGTDAFCDEAGVINPEMAGMQWSVEFSPAADHTRVTTVVTFASEEIMQKVVEMGFKEGFTAAHGNLDELLASKAA